MKSLLSLERVVALHQVMIILSAGRYTSQITDLSLLIDEWRRAYDVGEERDPPPLSLDQVMSLRRAVAMTKDEIPSRVFVSGDTISSRLLLAALGELEAFKRRGGPDSVKGGVAS